MASKRSNYNSYMDRFNKLILDNDKETIDFRQSLGQNYVIDFGRDRDSRAMNRARGGTVSRSVGRNPDVLARFSGSHNNNQIDLKLSIKKISTNYSSGNKWSSIANFLNQQQSTYEKQKHKFI